MYEFCLDKKETEDKDFIKKLNLKSVFFLDLKKNCVFIEKGKKHPFAKLSRKNAGSSKKAFLHYLPGKRSFHAPEKEIKQVTMKIIKEKGSVVVINPNLIKSYPYYFECYLHISKLAKKYDVKIFISSFAKQKLDLLSRQEILAFAKKLKLDLKNISNFATFL